MNKDIIDLKLEYLNLLTNRNKINKGDIRAFIGVRTWIHETDYIKNGEDKYTAHIAALESSTKELKESLIKNNFNRNLKSSIEFWVKNKKALEREKGGKPLLPLPIPNMRNWRKNGLNSISLFSGALGLDLGFLAAGFDLRFTNDISQESQNTVNKNLPTVPFLLKDFSKVKTEEVLEKAGLKIGEVDVLTGGPPCQPFSTAGNRQGFNDPRSSPLKEFIRAIKEIRPRAFVMEEVTGILSSRLKHITIAERHCRDLIPEEEKGTVFKTILDMLNSTGYKYVYGVLNAADFGSPQVRKRLIFIGLKEGIPLFPEQTHTNILQQNLYNRNLLPWNSFWDATVDIQGGKDNNESLMLSKSMARYMSYIPPGGHWRHLPEIIIKDAMGGAYLSGGGKMGYYRRLAWDEPSPTLVTTPAQKGTLFCHPEAMRFLSIKEYKRVQGFPDDWEISGSLLNKYKLIGDAVPIHLSYAIAKKLVSLLKN